MEITADMIKELRALTGAGILDCRKALTESGGDLQKAVDWLRQKASQGMVELYSHGGGRVGVMVEVNCETDFVARSEAFRNFAHEVALQIAAGAPAYISESDIPADVLEHESEIARKRALDEGKPAPVAEKIVEGRLNKFKDESVLLRQAYIRDDALTVEKLLHQTIASTGENVVVRRFQRWELGEASGE